MPLVQLKRHNRYDYSPLPERPDFSWPDGKRLAVCINNNIEVFSFLSGLGSDSTSLTAPQTTRNYAWRDYGNRVGQWYVFDLLEEYGLPASHNINSMLIAECPQIVARIKQRVKNWQQQAAPLASQCPASAPIRQRSRKHM